MLYAKYVNQDAGYPCDIAKCKKYLKLNEMYEVDSVTINTYSTAIYLKEFCGCWNVVNFEFYDKNEKGQLIPYDIFYDNKYINLIRRNII